MKKPVGTQLCITGLLVLLTSFAWAAFDADLALAARGLGGALIVSGLGVRGSASAFGRVAVKWLGLLLLIPGLLALLLLAYLRSAELQISFSWLVSWFLGLFALCGAVFVLSSRERAQGLTEQQQQAHADLALRLGRAYRAKADPLRARWRSLFFVALLLAECALAVRWAGLPLAKLPALLLASWLVAGATGVLHELAHTLWGMVMGYDVTAITVGGGPFVARFLLGTVAVELGPLPLHGRVRFAFGETPVLRGLRSAAWAGPVSGILPSFLGTLGMVFFERSETAFWVSASACLAGLLSLAQLSPHWFGNRISYRDGTWLFSNEARRRSTFVLLELEALCSGRAASAEARALLPRFVDFWERLVRESNEEQRVRLLAALASVTSDAESAPLGESTLCEHFARGLLASRDAEG